MLRESGVRSEESGAGVSHETLADEQVGSVETLIDGSVFVSSSPAMLQIREQVEKIASFNLPVLILGESGSGKEVVARLIHSCSSRANRRFLKVNCAALPESLLESELFGHECGAFTGAIRSRPGKFEFCNSGTILLDEIGEMSPALQAKLLHVLQDKTFSRLGAHTAISVDVRIIAATNVNITQAIESGSMRKDLYYRLNTFVISLPPLRARQSEIPILLEHFIQRFARDYHYAALPVSQKLVEACIRYPWPGNIRELQGFVHRLLIQRDEREALQELQTCALMVTVQGAALRGIGNANPGDLKALGRETKSSVEREAISRMLSETRFNRTVAARRLNISYRSLITKVRQYGLAENAAVASRSDPRLEENES